MSWQMLLSNGKTQSTDLRKFVMIQPVLDYNALQPGAEATEAGPQGRRRSQDQHPRRTEFAALRACG